MEAVSTSKTTVIYYLNYPCGDLHLGQLALGGDWRRRL